MSDYDVIVCGGGPSGWIAAVAAARQGAHTALVERFGFLGGTATAGMVVPVSGFFKNGQLCVGGIPLSFIKELEKYGAAQFEMPKGHVSINTEYYKLIAQRMVLESGVDLLTNTCLTAVEMDGTSASSIQIYSKSGTEYLRAKCYVDATGDGDLCHHAGLPLTTGKDPQPISLCFVLGGVDCTTELLKDFIHHTGKDGTHSCHAGIHRFLQENLSGKDILFGGPWFNTLLCGDAIAVNVTRCSADPLDVRAYALAECRLREDMFRITELLKKNYPEFRNCHISASACNAGVRESRHLCGAYTLTGKDISEGVSFDDTIAFCSHPMDIHIPGSSEQELHEINAPGAIPFRTLYAPGFPNILASGRIISADVFAYASIRVQATVMAIGQAAGTAAALCVGENCSAEALPVRTLRSALKSMQAII